MSTMIGAPTILAKWNFMINGADAVAAGIKLAYLDRETILWGNVKRHCDELDAKTVNPSLSWSRKLSPRLTLHTYWSTGIGKVKARLSNYGQRKLWESKYPEGNYDDRNENPDQDNRQKEQSNSDSLTRRSLQVQSVTGLTGDQFQITGEFKRGRNKKILLTSRIERSEIETLKSNGFRLTAAQQWIWNNFHFRFGIGLQYRVISGQDLDGEIIDDTGMEPASDIDFYWRF